MYLFVKLYKVLFCNFGRRFRSSLIRKRKIILNAEIGIFLKNKICHICDFIHILSLFTFTCLFQLFDINISLVCFCPNSVDISRLHLGKYRYSGIERLLGFPSSSLSTKKLLLLLHKCMVNISNTLVTLLRTVVHREALTVKVCLYPRISWENPIFAELWITTIGKICLFIYCTLQKFLDKSFLLKCLCNLLNLQVWNIEVP